MTNPLPDFVSSLFWVAAVLAVCVLIYVGIRVMKGKSVPKALAPVAGVEAQLIPAVQALLAHLHDKAQSAPAPAAAPAPPAAPASDYVPNRLSNTPDWRHWTDVSAEGYPLIYAIALAADGSKSVDPRVPARLYYDGQTFADVAEVRDYMVRLRTRADGMAATDASVDVPGVGFPIFAPDVVATSLVVFDTAPSEGLRWFHLLTAEHYALQNRGMRRANINTAVQAANSGAPPDGWAGSPQQAFRG